MNELTLSPGVVQGAIELLEISARQQITFAQITESLRTLGNMPVPLVCNISQRMDWVTVGQAGCLEATEAGQRVLDLQTYEERLRQSILDYIAVEKPAWLQSATFGRQRVLRFVGLHLGQVFGEAGLVDGTDPEVIAFWDRLAAAARGRQNDRATEIGRAGERLTFEFEARRTGRRPVWTAVDNNADGYDILSVVDRGDLRKLSIEVKTSSLGVAGSMHITRNEWDRAADVDNHLFHLWAIKDGDGTRLALVPTGLMALHVPSDVGSGKWESIEVPFHAFLDRFTLQPE